MGILVLTVGLIVLSVLFGKGELKGMRPLIIVLPVAIALSTGLAEALVPARRWATLRAAAEAIQRAIYRCWSSRIPVDGEEADETTADVIERATDRPSLTEQIIEIDQFVLRSGVALALVNPIRGRPDKFPASFDEFATLTVRGYMEERLDEQLRYYRRRATVMRARESVAVAASVVLVAAATGLAAELQFALWVPLLVFLASAVTVLQQRSRWQDQIRLYGLTVAQLEALRGRALETRVKNREFLIQLVQNVENALEQEQSGWLQDMSRVIDESKRYSQPFLGDYT